MRQPVHLHVRAACGARGPDGVRKSSETAPPARLGLLPSPICAARSARRTVRGSPRELSYPSSVQHHYLKAKVCIIYPDCIYKWSLANNSAKYDL